MIRVRSFIFAFLIFVSASTAIGADFWIEKVAVTESADGSIVCTNDDSYAGSAHSLTNIPAGMNGYFQFTVNNCYGVVGITSNPLEGGFEEIDHAFQLWAGNTLNIMENGATKWAGTQGSWAKGDVLKILRAGITVSYYKNESLLYTSTETSLSTLYADFAFGGANTGFDMPILYAHNVDLFWKQKVGVTEATNGNIICFSMADFAGHAHSIRSIPQFTDGYFQFTVNNCIGLVGISSIPEATSDTQIDHAFHFKENNTLDILENGFIQWEGTPNNSWMKGDVMRIEIKGSSLKYYKNGILLHTSTRYLLSDLFANFLIGGYNTGFDDPVLFVAPPVDPPLGFWTEKVSVTESPDGSINGTSNDDYASHAYSVASIPEGRDGYFQFTVNNCYGMIGLTSDPIGGGYKQIDYAFQLWARNAVNIMENSVTKLEGADGSWSKGDVLKIERVGTSIKYYRNGNLLYTSATGASNALYADFAFGGANTGFDTPILNIYPLVDPPLGFWTEKVEVTESSNGSIVCTSDVHLDGHAYSVTSIPARSDGYFQFTVNNCDGVIGLSSEPIGGGYVQISYAFQLEAGSTINIIENGVVKSTDVGSWTKGDSLKIERKGSTVTYYKNGNPVYTSNVASASILYADFAFDGSGTGFDLPVLFSDTSAATIKVFNFVTANGDGKNDYFFINDLYKSTQHELFIFNTLGNVVFHSTDYQNDWNGKDLENGTYFYWLLYDGKEKRDALFLSK